jgi:hypothetical protein
MFIAKVESGDMNKRGYLSIAAMENAQPINRI